MKHLEIGSNCYVHLIENTIYLYVDNECTEVLYLDNIEHTDNPIPLIQQEIELMCKPSLYDSLDILI